MKKYIICSLTILLILLSHIVKAQQEREFLIGADRPVSISGFMGLMTEISSLEGEVVPSVGAGIALLLDQTFYIGFYGLGTIKSLEKQLLQYQQVDMAFGHGGLWMGYIHQSERLLHLGVSLKIGGGGVYLAERRGHEFIFEEKNKIDEDALFVLIPQAEMELNVAPWMKLNLGLGYRFVDGVDTPYLNENDFASPVGSLGFYFGWFRHKI